MAKTRDLLEHWFFLSTIHHMLVDLVIATPIVIVARITEARRISFLV